MCQSDVLIYYKNAQYSAVELEQNTSTINDRLSATTRISATLE